MSSPTIQSNMATDTKTAEFTYTTPFRLSLSPRSPWALTMKYPQSTGTPEKGVVWDNFSESPWLGSGVEGVLIRTVWSQYELSCIKEYSGRGADNA